MQAHHNSCTQELLKLLQPGLETDLEHGDLECLARKLLLETLAKVSGDYCPTITENTTRTYYSK